MGGHLGTMIEHTRVAVMPLDRFLQAVEKELAKFQRQEIEFRKKDRKDRAAELRIHLRDDSHLTDLLFQRPARAVR
jgi:hypothetical protein